MANKSFYIKGEFSGRTTPVAGGPRVSKDKSHMDVDIYQRDKGDAIKIVEIESTQNKANLITKVKIYPMDGSDPIIHEIKSRY